MTEPTLSGSADEEFWEPGEPERVHPECPIGNGTRWLAALREIRDRDWVENVLDPQWAAQVAKEALRDA